MIVRLLMLSAQRKGEVGGLAWAELSADRSLWTLRARRSKNERELETPLSATGVRADRRVSSVAEPAVSVRPRRQDAVQRVEPLQGTARRKDRQATGGELKPWTLHDLRRSERPHERPRDRPAAHHRGNPRACLGTQGGVQESTTERHIVPRRRQRRRAGAIGSPGQSRKR